MPKRFKLNVQLVPVTGSRFQPTGFPDLGTATFEKPGPNGEWIKAILVESEQSMANHLEATGWDRGRQQPVGQLAGLPFVQVVNREGEYLTSSRTEAHRLSSAFIREGFVDGVKATDILKDRLGLGDDRPLSARHIAAAVLRLDPLCLVHGVFFADNSLPGQPKITRALTSFIEADDVKAAEYGGVKKDDVRHKNVEDGGSNEGYGTIPFHRTVWTARTITASFVLDLDQIRSYGLDANASRLVEVIALWEIRSMLEGGLRLRTMCDLEPVDDSQFGGLPGAAELTDEIRSLAIMVSDQLGGGEVLTVVWGKGKP